VAATSRARTRPRRRTRRIRTLERAYVQIGIFSVQENANNTGQTLRNAGLVPTIHDQTSNGRRFWRVVVGPAPTARIARPSSTPYAGSASGMPISSPARARTGATLPRMKA
jgi:cell division septation protein DedD